MGALEKATRLVSDRLANAVQASEGARAVAEEASGSVSLLEAQLFGSSASAMGEGKGCGLISQLKAETQRTSKALEALRRDFAPEGVRTKSDVKIEPESLSLDCSSVDTSSHGRIPRNQSHPAATAAAAANANMDELVSSQQSCCQESVTTFAAVPDRISTPGEDATVLHKTMYFERLASDGGGKALHALDPSSGGPDVPQCSPRLWELPSSSIAVYGDAAATGSPSEGTMTSCTPPSPPSATEVTSPSSTSSSPSPQIPLGIDAMSPQVRDRSIASLSFDADYSLPHQVSILSFTSASPEGQGDSSSPNGQEDRCYETPVEQETWDCVDTAPLVTGLTDPLEVSSRTASDPTAEVGMDDSVEISGEAERMAEMLSVPPLDPAHALPSEMTSVAFTEAAVSPETAVVKAAEGNESSPEASATIIVVAGEDIIGHASASPSSKTSVEGGRGKDISGELGHDLSFSRGIHQKETDVADAYFHGSLDKSESPGRSPPLAAVTNTDLPVQGFPSRFSPYEEENGSVGPQPTPHIVEGQCSPFSLPFEGSNNDSLSEFVHPSGAALLADMFRPMCSAYMYRVTVTTGTKVGAGLDEDVHLTLVGNLGSYQHVLQNNKSGNGELAGASRFQRGQVDVFEMDAGADLGDVTALQVRRRA